MPTYEITGPDGKVYEINAPEGATEQQAFDFFKQQMGGKPSSLLPNMDQLLDMSKSRGEITNMVADELKKLPTEKQDEALKQWSTAYVAKEREGMGSASKFVQDQIFGAASQIPVIGSSIDEVKAGFNSLFRGTDYNVDRQLAETRLQQGNDQATLPAKAVGFASTLALPGANIPKLGTAGNAALTGLIYGAGEGLASNSDNRIGGAIEGGAIGGTIGGTIGVAIGGVAGKLLQKAFGGPKGQPSLPSVDEIKAASQNLFENVSKSGIRVKEKVMQDILSKAITNSTEHGYLPEIHGETKKLFGVIISRMRKYGTNINELQTIRSAAKAAAKDGGPESPFLGQIANAIDDKLDNLMASDVKLSASKVDKVIDDLKEARNQWKTFRKSELVEEAMNSAKMRSSGYSASGVENAIRTDFRQLSNKIRKNNGLSKLFTEQEKNIIEKVATGGFTRNTLRTIGKLAPSSPLVSLAGAGLGGATLGPLGYFAAPAIGLLSKRRADKMAITAQNKAFDMVRSGGLQHQKGPYIQSIGKMILQNAGR